MLKLIPAYGSIVSGITAATATRGIGDAAIAFFIDHIPAEEVKKKLAWNTK